MCLVKIWQWGHVKGIFHRGMPKSVFGKEYAQKAVISFLEWCVLYFL